MSAAEKSSNRRGAYETDLKQEKDGTYYRWLGQNQNRTKQKFRLGNNKAVARKRMSLIQLLFQSQSEAARFYGGGWVPEFLANAKLVAKGKKATLPRLKLFVNDSDFIQQSPETYAKLLLALNKHEVLFEAESPQHLSEAVSAISNRQKKDRILKSKLADTNPDKNPTGQVLCEAFTAYKAHVKAKYVDERNEITQWGKKKIDYVNSIIHYVKSSQGKSDSDFNVLEVDLADLTLECCQRVVDTFRNRPLSRRSKETERLKPKSTSGLMKELNEFWEWLDLSDQWQWERPRKFSKLNTKIAELSHDEAFEEKNKREKWNITDEEIRILFNTCTPVERVILLLGLNCAFGAAEIGCLRKGFIKFETNEIDGIRFKTLVDSRHKLWPETSKALKWELARRETLPQLEEHSEIVFLSNRGLPLWKKTKSGNASNGIARRWNSLMKRVRKDHPEFRVISFGKLRKTAAIRVLELADATTASLILAHGVPSSDKLLKNYISIPWQDLYDAQLAYGDAIRPLITTDFDPFMERPKTYVGVEKRDRAVSLRDSGMPATAIAKELGLNVATVYRYLSSQQSDSTTD